MAEISVPEEEFGEPALNYWKPVAKPPPVIPPFVPNCVGNGYDPCGWTFPVPAYIQPVCPPPQLYHHTPYPLTNVIYPYIQNQIMVPPCDTTCDVQRRQIPQCSLLGADPVLYTMPANPNFEQDSQSMTENMIQDEVTRAAKTLFSKRNRTLLHWLNPDINKNQIKIDVNAAWESLPAAEKMFYISQVLGKFSPHVTSLMVNPQLEPSQVKSSCIDRSYSRTTEGESKSPPGTKVKRKAKKTTQKSKSEVNSAIKEELKTDEESCESSALVVDVGNVEEPKPIGSNGETPRVKRKYTKRKRKESSADQTVIKNGSDSCSLPVDVKNIKLEPGSDFPVDIKDIKVEPGTECPVDIKNIKKETGIEFPLDVRKITKEQSTEVPDIKSIKVEPGSKVDENLNNLLPRPKRKYIKRKLVRKKYKRREPKQKPPITSTDSLEKRESEVKEQEPDQDENEEIEMDLWIELGDDSILTNEEVDSFFDSIEDPESLFRELGIIEDNSF